MGVTTYYLMHTTGKYLLNHKMIYYLSKIYQKSDINVENNHASIDLENFSNLRQNFANFWYMIDLFLPKFGKCKCSCATLSKRRLQLGLECCCITQYHFSLLRQGFAVCLWFHYVQNLFCLLFFIQQTPFTGVSTFGRWNDSALWQCYFEILVWIGSL